MVKAVVEEEEVTGSRRETSPLYAEQLIREEHRVPVVLSFQRGIYGINQFSKAVLLCKRLVSRSVVRSFPRF